MSKIVIGNWKMKLGRQEALKLADGVKNIKNKSVETVVCPSFLDIVGVSHILKGSQVQLGAQDCFWENKGAYTGEVSAEGIKEAGCHFAIVGHSERRMNLKETNDMVHRKVANCFEHGITPIICVGETFEERQAGSADYVVMNQVLKALDGAKCGINQRIIVAYEPVWVIGSGRPIETDEALFTVALIRQALYDIFPSELIQKNCQIVYGGSVNEENITHFVKHKEIDGVLVGNSSLEPTTFAALVAKSDL